MLARDFHGRNRAHVPGLLRRFYLWLRGSEQVLVRPAAELPLVLIAYAAGDLEGVERLQHSLEETWLLLPDSFRRRYAGILEQAPPLIVVLLRQRNLCGCLGHHHPRGTESRLTRRLRGISGVRTGELDLAFKSIREWEPLPLSRLALPEENSEEIGSYQWHLALLSVFLHEIHHLVQPREPEAAVREQSQRFYVDALTHFISHHFGVEYGLRGDMAAHTMTGSKTGSNRENG